MGNNDLKNTINNFISNEGKSNSPQQEQELDCSSGVCIIKGDKSLVERINKKVITEDGRELLL